MVENGFIRITRSYDCLQSLLATWAQYCEKFAVVQHEGEKTEKIHVHILMYNMSRTWKQFQNIAERDFPSIWSSIKGNENISKKKAYKYDAMSTIRYMLKGKLELSYNKGYDEDLLRDARASWKVEPVKKSKLQEQLERFSTYVYEASCGEITYGDLKSFSIARKYAGRFVFKEYNNTFPMPMAMNLLKSIVYTVMFDNEFELDVSDDIEKKWTI